MRKTITLKVTGPQQMHCSGCESTVTYALAQLPQVAGVTADHKSQRITLELESGELESGADLARVQDELRWLGYETEVAS